MLKMCALLYYLCLTYALFHVFFPFNRTPTPVLYSFSNWESRGIILYFPEPSVELVLGPSSGLFSCGEEDCPRHLKFATSHPQRKTVTDPMLPDFRRTCKINHSCDLIFIIANPTDKFYDCLPEKY